MQQFRPLPRFDLIEEAEPVEMPLAPTTDPMPALTDPQQPVASSSLFAKMNLRPDGTTSQFVRINAQPGGTNPQFAAFHPQSGTTDPQLPSTAPQPAAAYQERPTQTTARIPIVVLNGTSSMSTTDQLTALMGKSHATGKQPLLTTALQASMSAKITRTGETSRLVVIPGAGVRKKKISKTSPSRRLNPRLRQGVVFTAALIIVMCTLTTLVPLSNDQNGDNLFANINGWLHFAQFDGNIQAQQGDQSTVSTALNGPGLPYMAIANSPYVAVAEQAAVNAGIPPAYFVRQIQQESGFNPNAVSVTNAQGIAQFEPYTASGLGINSWDPNSALPGAARLMAGYYHQYGNYAKALGAYNAGPGAVQGAVNSCGTYWLSCMPSQSQDYVYRIMGV
ncbi:MAG TPA: transglycosylase SLT domain-containing protein [Ktedonobacteraceae bacterium]|jgi:hypothetical protein